MEIKNEQVDTFKQRCQPGLWLFGNKKMFCPKICFATLCLCHKYHFYRVYASMHATSCCNIIRLYSLSSQKLAFIVGCWGEVQQGGSEPWYKRGGPTKVGVSKSFLFTVSSLVVKIKNTRLNKNTKISISHPDPTPITSSPSPTRPPPRPKSSLTNVKSLMR